MCGKCSVMVVSDECRVMVVCGEYGAMVVCGECRVMVVCGEWYNTTFIQLHASHIELQHYQEEPLLAQQLSSCLLGVFRSGWCPLHPRL